MELSLWQKRNVSFKKKCVYKIGSKAGFFSEYNNMLFALLYCTMNGYQFELCSKWANFRYDKGWNDYFEPFCIERNFILDYYYFNDRLRYNPIRKKEKYKGYLMLFFFGWIYSIYTLYNRIKLFTWHSENIYRKQSLVDNYNVPELNIKGTFLDLCSEINKTIWRYNDKTKREIDELIPYVDSEYVSIHVRRGDKQTEIAHTSIDKYITCLSEKTSIRNCFVATDDYSVYKQLCKTYPQWHFFTITRPDELGFNEYAYNDRDKRAKHKEMIELFATIEIMSQSQLFVGTMSSNIGMYMRWRMPEGKCIGVDYDEWRIW